MFTTTDKFEAHRQLYADLVQKLLVQQAYKLNIALKAQLPTKPGLYVITKSNADGDEYLRAGSSPKAQAGLQGRICNHHLYGNANSDLIQQVVNKKKLGRRDARVWIGQNCVVQWIVEQDADTLCWAEHYMLSLLRPIWCR